MTTWIYQLYKKKKKIIQIHEALQFLQWDFIFCGVEFSGRAKKEEKEKMSWLKTNT